MVKYHSKKEFDEIAKVADHVTEYFSQLFSSGKPNFKICLEKENEGEVNVQEISNNLDFTIGIGMRGYCREREGVRNISLIKKDLSLISHEIAHAYFDLTHTPPEAPDFKQKGVIEIIKEGLIHNMCSEAFARLAGQAYLLKIKAPLNPQKHIYAHNVNEDTSQLKNHVLSGSLKDIKEFDYKAFMQMVKGGEKSFARDFGNLTRIAYILGMQFGSHLYQPETKLSVSIVNTEDHCVYEVEEKIDKPINLRNLERILKAMYKSGTGNISKHVNSKILEHEKLIMDSIINSFKE